MFTSGNGCLIVGVGTALSIGEWPIGHFGMRRITVADQRKWLKESLMSAVTPEDMQDVVLMLINRAKGGSIAAAKELLDRVLGKPTQEMVLEQRNARSPDEVRQSLAALLLKHPEIKGTLERAQAVREQEAVEGPHSPSVNKGEVGAMMNPESVEDD